ncbi:FAD-dependent oxidoreductase [uncultured Sharpea sp.]|uniref:FAD-dependent oxidoreductase n=1 Tax=uncultured Sharpea sp. TaxID=1112738 RepID=UPI00258F73EB|nr:FAD-dependent oxidoreductase [uncultured Sharpea sp.]
MKETYMKECGTSFNALTVNEEASRCLLCYDAPCSKACPANTDPARFIRSVRFKNYKGAAEIIRENNGLGDICARVCPTEKYCQLGCSRSGIDRPIDIGGIQKFVTDFEKASHMHILEKGTPNGKKVGIIGTGPAALEAGLRLLIMGYQVDYYEKEGLAGGYLRTGIPEYRLPNAIVDDNIHRLENLGATFHYNTEIGKDRTFEDLKQEFDAVLVAVGYSKAKSLPMFEKNPYVISAIDFLHNVKDDQGSHDVKNNVLVIGGGDVAMDVVTTLKKLGCEHVTDVVYEELSEFLASEKELAGAREAGVTIIDGYVPDAVNGNVVTFKARHIDATYTLTADQIILAVGQKPDQTFGLPMEANEVKEDNYHVDGNVFVAGDITKGDKTVVWAVKKGKEAACAIDSYLGGKDHD